MARLMDHAIAQGKAPADVILDALNEHDTITEACQSLDMDYKAIYKWIKRLDIQKVYVLPETKNPSNKSA